MKITQQDIVNTISNSQANRVFNSLKTEAGGGSPASNVNASSDGVDLGSQSGLLSQALSAGADSRAAWIEQLRQSVQSGQYQVDPVALSKSIVQAALNGG